MEVINTRSKLIYDVKIPNDALIMKHCEYSGYISLDQYFKYHKQKHQRVASFHDNTSNISSRISREFDGLFTNAMTNTLFFA